MDKTRPNRTVLAISGPDRTAFLQGLVSNDVNRATDGPVYAALLSPQGKYLADFFLLDQNGTLLLDVATELSEMLAQRLNMYRLRADVKIDVTDLLVSRGTGTPPPGAVADPRTPALGWRLYGHETVNDGANWDALRVAHCIPETGIELIPNETYILEAGFERLNGVDFKKGCYVGQEVTARMKHKTALKKGLVRVSVDGFAPVGTEIMSAGKPAGILFTQSDGAGIAHLRFDRAQGELMAADALVRFEPSS